MKELVDYFITETNKKFDRLEEKAEDNYNAVRGEIKDIKSDVKLILKTKYKIVGGTVAASIILTGLFQIIAFLNQGQ